MTQPLFLAPDLEFEKIAAETALPEDPNQWPQEVLQELYKQVPYISDFEPHVQMEKADGEKGYGFGHIQIGSQTEIQLGADPRQAANAGIRTARIPIIIKDGKLAPLDVIITDDSKVRPLTEQRLRQVIFRPQIHDVTAQTPGDQSMVSQLYPPYRTGGNSDGAMGKMGSALEDYIVDDTVKTAAAIDDHIAGDNKHGRLNKVVSEGELTEGGGHLASFIQKNASAKAGGRRTQRTMSKTGSILSAILPTINESDFVEFRGSASNPTTTAAFVKNANAVHPALSLLLNHDPSDFSVEKRAAALAASIKPSVTQVQRVDGGYRVKTASHLHWDPRETIVDRGTVVAQFGVKLALATDTEGAVTMAEGADAAEPVSDSDMGNAGPIIDYGLYKVQDDKGSEHIGVVIPNLIDTDGLELPLSLFTNGSVATVQGDIIGQEAGDAYDLPTSDTPSGYGFFFTTSGEGGVQATIPYTINSSTSGPDGGPSDMQAETFDGAPVTLSRQPGLIKLIVSPDGKLLIPDSWLWSPLGEAGAVSLATTESGVDKEASLSASFDAVELRSNGHNSFSINGLPVEKLAHADREFLDVDDAMFLLSGLGVDADYGVLKLASATTQRRPIMVKVGRELTTAREARDESIKQASSRNVVSLRRCLVKEAAVLPDPMSVDAVLSLGFVNPENTQTFVDHLPALEDAQCKMCELLIATRLGLQDIPVSALEKAVRTTEEVIQGLKVIAFQG